MFAYYLLSMSSSINILQQIDNNLVKQQASAQKSWFRELSHRPGGISGITSVVGFDCNCAFTLHISNLSSNDDVLGPVNSSEITQDGVEYQVSQTKAVAARRYGRFGVVVWCHLSCLVRRVAS